MIGSHGSRLLLALATALLVAGLLAACGSDSETGSDQFRDQTDSAILDFGSEGSEGELEAGTEVVEAFLASRAAGEWAEACAQLSVAMLAKIERLASTATELADKSCPSFLGAFTRLSAKEREDTTVDAGSLREQGRRAFLIYRGDGEVVYAMPLSLEGEAWKVSSLAPKRLS